MREDHETLKAVMLHDVRYKLRPEHNIEEADFTKAFDALVGAVESVDVDPRIWAYLLRGQANYMEKSEWRQKEPLAQ